MIISERIFCVMEQKNITQLELSRRTGIATSNISDWKKKKTNPKADCLLSICDALEITPEQLLTGKGIDPEYKDEDANYEVTRSDIKILKQIHSLGDEQYKRLMAYMKALQKLEQMENMVELGKLFTQKELILGFTRKIFSILRISPWYKGSITTLLFRQVDPNHIRRQALIFHQILRLFLLVFYGERFWLK